MATAKLHYGDVGQPHVDGGRLNTLVAFRREFIQEFQQGGGIASLLHPQDAAAALLPASGHRPAPDSLWEGRC